MQVTLLMVETVDGKTTQAAAPHIHGWSSPEDVRYFHAMQSQYPVIIMGSTTYAAVRQSIKLSSSLTRIVLTTSPSHYASSAAPGKLEFTDESPKQLIDRLSREGITKCLLVGGSDVNASFLEAELITDARITIEPRLFGRGNALFRPFDTDVKLTLTDIERLNPQGTIVLSYLFHYDH
jgi:dihydrofolate reductase